MRLTSLWHTGQLYVTKTNTLNMFSFLMNNYNADFIRRNIYRLTEAEEANSNPTPVITVTISYISETISGIV